MNTKGKALLLLLTVVVLFAALPQDVDAQRRPVCYVFGYVEAREGDTWISIANHFGMTVSTLKAINPKGTKVVKGASIKVLVWIGCPR